MRGIEKNISPLNKTNISCPLYNATLIVYVSYVSYAPPSLAKETNNRITIASPCYTYMAGGTPKNFFKKAKTNLEFPPQILTLNFPLSKRKQKQKVFNFKSVTSEEGVTTRNNL